MPTKIEVDMIIGLIESLIKIVEAFKPDVANNPIIVELENAIKGLQAIGL